jgi:electron transfer flavoprotein alpha subunit
LLAGTGATDAATQFVGPGTVFVVECDVHLGELAVRLAPLSHIVSAHTLVLPASPDGRDLAPLLAAALERPLVTGATRLKQLSESVLRVTTVRSDGLADHVLRVSVASVVTLLPGTGHAAVRSGAVSSTVEVEVVNESQPLRAFLKNVHSVAVLPPDPTTMDLTEAACIVAGGQGLVGSDASSGVDRFAQLGQVGQYIGASLGGTRVASDAGWIPFERQIGTTGVQVSPRVYLSFGISGATQHTSGLGTPDHIISVNTDPSCPMMAMSDVAIVSDANAVVAALHKMLHGSPEPQHADRAGDA